MTLHTAQGNIDYTDEKLKRRQRLYMYYTSTRTRASAFKNVYRCVRSNPELRRSKLSKGARYAHKVVQLANP